MIIFEKVVKIETQIAFFNLFSLIDFMLVLWSNFAQLIYITLMVLHERDICIKNLKVAYVNRLNIFLFF